ncbi:MAG TPA: FtsX-like permease family protein [Kofleriaceae bacterium]|nr:FtsX-like permease family protein [Kofleriaceae bacterium]
MSALDRKLGRDLWRLKGQVATIGLVLACGIMAMIMLRSTWQSLIAARDVYYEQYRFADVFARLERAPEGVSARLEAIPGVALVHTRIVKDVMLPLASESDAVTGRIVSIPDQGTPPLDELYLRSGRLPSGDDEAVILEQFAIAQHVQPGDSLPVIINGRLRPIRVTGVALSPEYVLAMSGREMAPDNRRFVVLWMRRSFVAPAFRMEGAFNDVLLRLQPGTSLRGALEAVDRELAHYGGLHAVGRDKQMSNYALENELSVLRILALIIPAIFLAVAAFLVNVVISRLVFLERVEIAVLKALGFTNRRIMRHYLVFVALIVSIAAIAGIWSGVQAGRWMTNMYSDFYRFPTKVHQTSLALVMVTVGIGLVAAVVGAVASVRRIAKMPPAQAMRPPAPLAYRRFLLERLGIDRLIGPSAMMVVREVRRKPFRFLMSTLGIGMGIAIFVMGRFSWDSFDYLMGTTYRRAHHEDLVVMLTRATPARALHELEGIPGVQLAEGQRMVPVRVHSSSLWRDTAIVGMPPDPQLGLLLRHGKTPVELPPTGLVMTDKLAEILGVRIGDEIDVDLLEGDFSSRRLPVAGVVDEPFGLLMYARADWLSNVLREEPRVSTILLRVDALKSEAVRAQLKEVPAVLGVTSTDHLIRRYREQMGESMLVMALILTLSAAAIAIGVVYNNARVALSMRSRDLATLRVLGYTRVEISSILLGELTLQVLAGVPLGLWLGTLWSRALAASIDPETIRFSVHISDRTYVEAAVIAILSGLVSALLVRRKLDRLDLVGVLKSSE